MGIGIPYIAQFGRCEFQYCFLESVGRAFVANFGIISARVWVDRFVANFSIDSARVCAWPTAWPSVATPSKTMTVDSAQNWPFLTVDLKA
jgi:hypothetical protein